MMRHQTFCALSHLIKRLGFGAAIATALVVGAFGAGPADGLAGSAPKPCDACVVLLVPDLTVQSVGVVIQRGADFEPHYKLKVTVANTGRAASGAFDLQIVSGTVKPAHVLGTFASSGLDAGSNQTFFQSLTACNATVTVFVDPTNRILESNERNNTTIATVSC